MSRFDGLMYREANEFMRDLEASGLGHSMVMSSDGEATITSSHDLIRLRVSGGQVWHEERQFCCECGALRGWKRLEEHTHKELATGE